MAARRKNADGKLCCGTCGGLVVSGRRCKRCRNRKRKLVAAAKRQDEADARRAKFEAEKALDAKWRRDQLDRYTQQVLALRTTGERLAFYEKHPLVDYLQT